MLTSPRHAPTSARRVTSAMGMPGCKRAVWSRTSLLVAATSRQESRWNRFISEYSADARSQGRKVNMQEISQAYRALTEAEKASYIPTPPSSLQSVLAKPLGGSGTGGAAGALRPDKRASPVTAAAAAAPDAADRAEAFRAAAESLFNFVVKAGIANNQALIKPMLDALLDTLRDTLLDALLDFLKSATPSKRKALKAALRQLEEHL